MRHHRAATGLSDTARQPRSLATVGLPRKSGSRCLSEQLPRQPEPRPAAPIDGVLHAGGRTNSVERASWLKELTSDPALHGSLEAEPMPDPKIVAMACYALHREQLGVYYSVEKF